MIERLSFDFQAVRQILMRIARRQNDAKNVQIIRDAIKAKIEKIARKIQQLINCKSTAYVTLEFCDYYHESRTSEGSIITAILKH